MNVTGIDEIRTIDVTQLSHTEKEGLIFPGIESLKPGETLRIVLEFSPVPLVYLLKTGGDFDIAYEKEGPDEWILRVTRNGPAPGQKQQFKQLLAEIKEGEVSLEAKEKARKLLQTVDARTLGVLEQELIHEGVSRDAIRKSLCDIHLDIMRDRVVARRIAVEAPHPVHTFMEEHQAILENLHELAALTGRIRGVNSYAEMGDDLPKLQDIAHHLVEAEAHHLREEEALFPALEKHDITEPPLIMREDHVDFRKRKKELYLLSLRYEEYPFSEFRTKVIELGEFISRELESHIFKEDNILYQIALQVLAPPEWEYIKKLCDKIGYCCFTPEKQPEEQRKDGG